MTFQTFIKRGFMISLNKRYIKRLFMLRNNEFRSLTSRINDYEDKKDYSSFPDDVVMGLFFEVHNLEDSHHNFNALYKLFENKGFYDLDNKENIKKMVTLLVNEKLVTHVDYFLDILSKNRMKNLSKEKIFKKMEHSFSCPSQLYMFLYDMHQAKRLETVDMDKIIEKNGVNVDQCSIELFLHHKMPYDFFSQRENKLIPYEKLNDNNKALIREDDPEAYIVYEKTKLNQLINDPSVPHIERTQKRL